MYDIKRGSSYKKVVLLRETQASGERISLSAQSFSIFRPLSKGGLKFFLINKVFDGSADLLFASLLSNKRLSREEIERLKQIVNDLK